MKLLIKRLRKVVDARLRYFLCGEYGDRRGRAHFHVLLFGCDFSADRQRFKRLPSGPWLYTSDVLSKAWPYGRVTLGDVNYKTASYTAGYVLKKFTGEKAVSHYTRAHPDTGVVYQVEPEFATMSLRPGLGSTWFDRFKTDVYPSDTVVMDGRIVANAPRFYDKQLFEKELELLKRRRKRLALKQAADNTPERLATREQCALLKRDRFAREVE